MTMTNLPLDATNMLNKISEWNTMEWNAEEKNRRVKKEKKKSPA